MLYWAYGRRPQRKRAFIDKPAVRRLGFESLEQRAMLSVSSGSSPQQQTLSDLPVAQQQAISTAIGADQPAYHATTNAAGSVFANAANSFTAQLQSGAIRIATGADTWGMTLAGLGYSSVIQNIGAAQTSTSGNRADLRYGAVDEWYVNGPSGLEQGFTVAALSPNQTTGTLTVELSLTGSLIASVDSTGTGLTLARADGSSALVYSGLSACDATGKNLPATLQIQMVDGQQELLIHVNDSSASGQITIDPFVQAAEFAPSDTSGSNYFGETANSIAIDGDTMVVGALFADGPAGNQGAAYVFTTSGSTTSQVAKLIASDGQENAYFGSSAALSGNTIVIGAPSVDGDCLGEAYVFTKPVSGWADMTQSAILTGTDVTLNDSFGESVAIRGNTVVVGSPQGGTESRGAAYVFVEPADGWANMTQTGTLVSPHADFSFGQSIALSNSTLAVGARSAAYVFTKPVTGWADASEAAILTPSDSASISVFGYSIAATDDTVVVGRRTDASSGAAYVYSEPASGWTNMTETAELTTPDSESTLAWSVAISGNTVVAGSCRTDIDGREIQGAAYVFDEPATGWSNMTAATAELTASDGQSNEAFGSAVAMSGDSVAITAAYANTGMGRVYLFTQPTSGWTNSTELGTLVSTDEAANDQFGQSIAISGNTIVVGAPGATIGFHKNQGAAYVFTESASNPADVTLVATLTASDGAANDMFGISVAISGSTIAIGGTTGAYVFTKPASGWTDMTQTAVLTPTGSTSADVAVAISGGTIVVGEGASNSPDNSLPQVGIAYVFVEPSAGWTNMTQTASLSPSDGTPELQFGRAVAIDGNTIVVGAPTYEMDGYSAAYVFTEPASGWAEMTETAKLSPSVHSHNDYFGFSVAISGNTVVVGENGVNNDAGEACVYVEPASGWTSMTETADLTASGGATFLGYSVAISGDTIALSAVSGPAYLYMEPASGWTSMTQTAELSRDWNGRTIAISGDTVVSGDASYPGSSGADSGTVCSFSEPVSGWADMSPTAVFVPFSGIAQEQFGYSVAISGNTLVVGAPDATVGGNGDQGAAYVFALVGNGTNNMVQVAKLTAADGAAGDLFGSSVSIDGNTVVVGAPNADQSEGTAYIFTEPADGWANLTDPAELSASGGAAGDLFGTSVSVSGGTIVVGSPDAVNKLGAAYEFTEPASGWATATQTATLIASDAATGNLFGNSVAVNSNAVVIGAPGASQSQGAAYVFIEPAAGWADATESAQLTADDGAAGDQFGTSVAIEGTTIAVGAPNSLSTEGAVYAFVEPGTGWAEMTQTGKLTASDGQSNDELGVSVSIGNGSIVAGMGYAGSQGTFSAKAAYLFTLPSTGWVDMTQTAKLLASDGAKDSAFGNAVSISGNTAVVGAFDSTLADNGTQGMVYVFDPVPSITGVSSSASGAYQVGTTISITVIFNEPVSVTGLPQLLLNSGSDAAATYSGGSGTDTLTFTYTVAAGQSTPDLDYLSADALELAGGTIENAKGEAAILSLPSIGTDGLATQNIKVVSLSDGFESGTFSSWPWQSSTVGTASNWTVQSSMVHGGSFAAQSGAIGPGSSSTLSVTLTVGAGELSFWRKVTSASGSGSLIFEIDGVPLLQLSGNMPWQQSYFWVSAGQHTFTWLYGKDAGAAAGNDYALLDDVQFTPGNTLTIDGTPSNDVFTFDAGNGTFKVALNGELHQFTASQFGNFVFQGDGGSDLAVMAGSAQGDTAILHAGGSSQLKNPNAGYNVTVSGVATVGVTGHAGETAALYDSPGNDTFYAYADYGGNVLAGMLGTGYSISASGFNTNVASSTSGGSDQAAFFDAPGNDTYYAYADYNGKQLAGMYGSGYTNSASGFANNVGYSSMGGSDNAAFFDSTGNDTYFAYASYGGKPNAGMYGSGYFNSAVGFAANAGYSSHGGADLAVFYDSPTDDFFRAYAQYNGGGPFASMTGQGYANSASGFASVLAVASSGNDTANLYDSSGANVMNTDAAIALLYGNNYGEKATGFKIVNVHGALSGITFKSQSPISYQLNYVGS